jgi:N-acetylmuramoyl-L-alanine amidase
MYTNRKTTDFIIVHCSATSPSMDIGKEEITDWHVNGNGWLNLGYHYVIRRCGIIEVGRPLDVVGSHVYGYNSRSVSVCLVGGVEEDKVTPSDNFEQKQYKNLLLTLGFLHQIYPTAQICTHNSLDPSKACPSFSQERLEEGLEASGILTI